MKFNVLYAITQTLCCLSEKEIIYLYSIADGPALVRVNIYIRSISEIDDVRMVSIYFSERFYGFIFLPYSNLMQNILY